MRVKRSDTNHSMSMRASRHLQSKNSELETKDEDSSVMKEENTLVSVGSAVSSLASHMRNRQNFMVTQEDDP